MRIAGVLDSDMLEAKDSDDFFDLQLFRDELDEELVQCTKNLQSLDQDIMEACGKQGLVFRENCELNASKVMDGLRNKEHLKRDAEYLCKHDIFTQASKTNNNNNQFNNNNNRFNNNQFNNNNRPAIQQQQQQQQIRQQNNTVLQKKKDESCGKCGGELIQQTCQKPGANHGKEFLRCPPCGKFVRWIDNEDDNDADGQIRNSRNGFKNDKFKSRSSSAGKTRSYKRNVKYGGRNDNDSDDGDNDVQEENVRSDFMSASKKLRIDSNQNGRKPASSSHSSSVDRGSRQFNPAKSVVDAISKTGGSNSAPKRKFTVPSRNNEEKKKEEKKEYSDPIYEDERLAQIDPKHVEMILSEIMDNGSPVTWEDIAGLEFAKKTINEIVVWPMLRPDIFTGIRGPPKGVLLFGPPGTGKTLIGKAIACEAKATFFAISASSLTSKWVGEGEKMVRALFAVARIKQPSVIFIDEIDSLLTQRSESEVESTRRIKTEFLVQLDGVANGQEERLLLVGATNRPQELDEAARRRMTKRLYIPLPDGLARCHMVKSLLRDQTVDLQEEDYDVITRLSDGFSGADMKVLCSEASMGPIRDLPDIRMADSQIIRPIQMIDFTRALRSVRASVSSDEITSYITWDKKFGTTSGF